MSRKPNWQPMSRPGGVYCSPACGRGCTRAEHGEAVRKARELAQRLGDGWEPEVWENLGWFYKVEKGLAAIHPSRTGGYTVYFNSQHQVVANADTPEQALSAALRRAKAVAHALEKDINFVEIVP